MLRQFVRRLSHGQQVSANLDSLSTWSESCKSFKLNSYRSLINVKGPDASVFLQGLITNDINRLTWPNTFIIYATMLNNRGRTLFDTLIYNLNPQTSVSAKDLEPNYLLEIDYKQREQALKLFKTYRLRKKIDLALVDDQYALYSLFGEGKSDKESLNFSEGQSIILQDDPRWEEIGKRLLIKSDNSKKSFNSSVLD